MKAETFHVSCPYCKPLGSAVVHVQYRDGAHIADTAPRQCVQCHKYFDIRVRLQLEGVPLGPVDRNTAVRKALKNLVLGG